ncbi:MAG: RCC1 domain-containing protein [Actinomycetales bacterium]
MISPSQAVAAAGSQRAASVAVAMGGGHACAVMKDGSLWCWGANGYGQAGPDRQVRKPQRISDGLPAVREASLGGDFSCALTVGGEVYCWGKHSPALGSGVGVGRGQQLVPTKVIGLPADVVSISAGTAHACAATGDGQAYCWGSNFYGQLGTGARDGYSEEAALTAQPLPALGDRVRSLSSGLAHTCALVRGGGVWCWGRNLRGQLGLGSDQAWLTVPTGAVSLSDRARQVSAGLEHTCARLRSGELQCWGDNSNVQLSESLPRNYHYTPVTVPLPGVPVHVAAGFMHTCALLADQRVWCWGDTDRGALGAGDRDGRVLAGEAALPSVGTTGIASGAGGTCAVVSGNVWCWGLALLWDPQDSSGSSAWPMAVRHLPG